MTEKMTYKDHVALVRLQIAAAMKYALGGKWGKNQGSETLDEVEQAARAAANLADALDTVDAIARRLGIPDGDDGLMIVSADSVAHLMASPATDDE